MAIFFSEKLNAVCEFLASWLVSTEMAHRDEPVSIFTSKATKSPPSSGMNVMD